MESQPKNPEFRSNPESFHPCMMVISEKFFFKKLHYILTVNIMA